MVWIITVLFWRHCRTQYLSMLLFLDIVSWAQFYCENLHVRLKRMCENLRRSWSITAHAKKQKSTPCTAPSKRSLIVVHTNKYFVMTDRPTGILSSYVRMQFAKKFFSVLAGQRIASRQPGFPSRHDNGGVAHVSWCALLFSCLPARIYLVLFVCVCLVFIYQLGSILPCVFGFVFLFALFMTVPFCYRFLFCFKFLRP